MTSHELARKLLEMPDLSVYSDACGMVAEAIVGDVIDADDPRATTYMGSVYDQESYQKWYDEQPKSPCIILDSREGIEGLAATA